MDIDKNKNSLATRVMSFLKNNPSQKFTAIDIAEWVFKNYPEYCAEKKQRSKAIVRPMVNDEQLIEQIAAEMSRVRKQLQLFDCGLKTTQDRPMKYFYDPISDNKNRVEIREQVNTQIVGSEHELYPLLRQYLLNEHHIHSIRIDERRSSNTRGSGGNEWLHPDIVGFKDLTVNWNQEIIECLNMRNDQKHQLWSLEVKTLINLSNVRKYYFQALSNSSWANFGYLVASKIDEDAIEELRILYGRHGIGVMRINVNNPLDSEIIIPAREHDNIDWDTANRIHSENPDFRDFIELIKPQGVSQSINLLRHLNTAFINQSSKT